MAGTITHKWNGTVLTVTSDSGTSSCDLKGSQGDMGVRGPQGAPGVLVDTSGTILAPADNYYLKEEVDDAIAKSKKEVSDNITTIQTSVESDILELQNTASAHSKRIANLEHTLAPTFFETDDSVAYMKDVPEIALPYAEVNEIGGMSYKCENLAKPNIFTQWLTTANIADDGKITMTCTGDGTPFCIAFKATLKAGESYYVKLHNINSISRVIFFKDSNASTGSLKGFTSEGVYTATSDITIYIGVYMHDNVASGTVGSCYVMLNKGTTALPYQPYFTGLRDSKVTAIESVGTNLIPFPYNTSTGTISGVAFTVNNDGSVVANGTASSEYNAAFYLCDNLTLAAGTYMLSGIPSAVGTKGTITLYYKDESGEYTYINAYGGEEKTFTLTTSAKCAIYVQVFKGQSVSNLTFYPMINKGSTALPYAPYVKHTFPIPEAVQALEGYGQGTSKSCHNKVVIDPDNFIKKYVKAVAKIALTGSESVYFANYISDSIAQQFNIQQIQGIGSGLAVCDRLPGSWDVAGGWLGVASSAGQLLIGIPKVWLTPYGFVAGDSSTYVSSFKAYLKAEYDKGTPVTVCYKLASPTETDISDIVPDDNFIRVYGAGTVTAVNEYSYDVPTKITYQYKEATT